MCAVSSMDRVADFESVGWGFESLTACHGKTASEEGAVLLWHVESKGTRTRKGLSVIKLSGE